MFPLFFPLSFSHRLNNNTTVLYIQWGASCMSFCDAIYNRFYGVPFTTIHICIHTVDQEEGE